MNNIRKLNKNEVISIIRSSNPVENETDKSGVGYWLFEKKLKENFQTYFGESEYFPVIFLGLFDDYSNKCTAMLCYTNRYKNSFDGYPYIMIIQGIENKAGMRLLSSFMRLMKSEGEKGICIISPNDSVTKMYEKRGFVVYDDSGQYKKLKYTFPMDMNDSVFEEMINENYLSGAYGDPTYSVGSPNTRYTTGYMYSVKSLNSNLSGNKQPQKNGIQYIHVGTLVSSKDKKGNPVTGRVYKIEKDSDGFIKKVWVFGDNAKLINVSLDNIVALNNKNILFDDNGLSRYRLAESVKARGKPLNITFKSKRYILTLNEGRVVVGELIGGKLVSLEDVYTIEESFAKELLNKIHS